MARLQAMRQRPRP